VIVDQALVASFLSYPAILVAEFFLLWSVGIIVVVVVVVVVFRKNL
jgi:hypothetical protein